MSLNVLKTMIENVVEKNGLNSFKTQCRHGCKIIVFT